MTSPGSGDLLAGRYELRAILGEAPTHRTYRAFDREVEALVELWWHRPEVIGPEEADAFLARVAAARAVVDPHLRRLHDAGRAGGAAYLTCQLASEETLATRLRGVAPDAVDPARHAVALSSALSAAHDAGLVHGRLTPRDLALVAGRIKVGGVGLYAGVDAAVFAGDGRYLAPEVVAGGPATPRADVYGMAAVIADAAAGGVGEGARRRLVDQQPALWAILSPALSDEPARRPESVAELGGRLAEVLRGEPEGAAAATEIDRAALEDEEPEATVLDLQAPPGAAGAREAAGESVDDEEPTAIDARALPPPPRQQTDGGEPASVDLEPAGEAAADATPDTFDLDAPRFVSRKPDEPDRPGGATPILPLVDRPDMRPRLQTPAAREEPPDLGHLAPPRRPSGLRPWAYVAIGLIAAAVASLAVLLLTRDAPAPERAAAPPEVAAPRPAPPAPTVTPAPATDAQPACPEGMVAIPEAPVCVDAFESPGRGRLPETGIPRPDAEASCAARGARLCTAEEWEAACRGDDGASWPYGAAERPGLCNLATGSVEVAGAFSDCRDRHGLHDMSGNAAEWTQEGQIRGGSAVDGSSGRCSQRRPRPGRQEAYSDVGFRCCADRVAPSQPAR